MSMTKLSKQATNALINAHRSQGSPIIADPNTLAELSQLGLIGTGHGLTRKGTIVRERAVNAALDAAF